MTKVRVIYGSSNGNTRAAAEHIAAELNGEAINIGAAKISDFDAELLILGTSTWGIGELQDDWIDGLVLLDNIDWQGKKAAFFGLGDQCGFSDTYIDGVRELYDRVIINHAAVVGRWSSAGYQHNSSKAEIDGEFVGLALDEDNQSDLTASRIKTWCRQLQSEI